MTKIMQYFIINKHKMTTNDNKYDNKSVVLLPLVGELNI